MSIFTYLDGVVVGTSNIRLNAEGNQGYGGLPSAADGSGSQGSIVFDDPTGSLSVTGWQIVKVTEPDCASAPVLFYGTVADRTYRRGPYRTGPGREIDTTINDHNGFLSLRLLGGSGPSRPEETDIARLAWLLSDASLDGLVYDLGLVQGTGLTFDATNLQGMYASEVLADLASRYGQIFFTYWDQAAQKVGLFFDFPSATTFTSTLSISNDLSDITYDANKVVTGTVYPPLIDGELVADPSEVYSRIRFVYTGGVVWRTFAATAAQFFPEPLRYRSLQVENDHVGKATTATRFADAILTSDSQERMTVAFTVRLPATKVGLIQAGMRIHLTFTHLPGFETGAYTRIERINVVPTDGDPSQYDVHCECATAGLTSATGTGGGSTDPFPSVPPADSGPCGPDATYMSIASTASQSVQTITATAGQYIYILRITIDCQWLGVSEWSLWLTTDSGVGSPSSVDPDDYEVLKIIPANALPGTHSYGTWTSPDLAGDSTMHVLFVYPTQEGYGVFRGGSPVWEHSVITVANSGTYYLRSGNIVGDGYFGATGYTANICVVVSDLPPEDFISPSLDSSSTSDPPTSGKPVGPETPTPAPDGVTTVFNSANPYALNSMHVEMNGSELALDVDFTESDNGAGEITFTDPPPTGAEIHIWYLVL